MAWAESDLISAWSALRQKESHEDWRFAHLGNAGILKIEAGYREPGGLECISVTFPVGAEIGSAALPSGSGFDAVLVSQDSSKTMGLSIALVRRAEGEASMFQLMAVDVLRSLQSGPASSPALLLERYLRRIRDWQEFMARSGRRPLSPEKQTGLMGELLILKTIASTRAGPRAAVIAWQGPRHAAQDFHIGSGAVEVKSTIARGSFAATINSMEQLDCERAPLFLVACRFAEDAAGSTLPELVSELRAVAKNHDISREFEALLIFADYYPEHEPAYSRPLHLVDLRCFPVDEEFPCLRKSTLSPVLTSARYVLDLDRFEGASMEIAEMFTSLGIS